MAETIVFNDRDEIKKRMSEYCGCAHNMALEDVETEYKSKCDAIFIDPCIRLSDAVDICEKIVQEHLETMVSAINKELKKMKYL